MANKSKAKGTAAETRIVNYLRAAGIECDRQPLKGNNDEGDIWFIDAHLNNCKGIIEVKAGKQTAAYSRTTKQTWLAQTETEAQNASSNGDYPLKGYLIIAKHGANIADYEVWTEGGCYFQYLDQFVIARGGTPKIFKGGKPI